MVAYQVFMFSLLLHQTKTYPPTETGTIGNYLSLYFFFSWPIWCLGLTFDFALEDHSWLGSGNYMECWDLTQVGLVSGVQGECLNCCIITLFPINIFQKGVSQVFRKSSSTCKIAKDWTKFTSQWGGGRKQLHFQVL